MNEYTIAKHFKIDDGINVYLLRISENTSHCNLAIIPQAQVDDISKYRVKEDADKRILARCFLYEYLRERDGVTDFELHFNGYKKPFLKAAPGIDFSFSYAKDYVLVAISGDKKVGVDIEYINRDLDLNELAPEIMCAAELQRFHSYPSRSLGQYHYFFKLFAAKESIIKSFGTGLYFDVKNLNVESNGEYKYLTLTYNYQDLEVWKDEYVLALCYGE